MDETEDMDDIEKIELRTIGKPNRIPEFLDDDRFTQVIQEVLDTSIVYTEDNASVVKKQTQRPTKNKL